MRPVWDGGDGWDPRQTRRDPTGLGVGWAGGGVHPITLDGTGSGAEYRPGVSAAPLSPVANYVPTPASSLGGSDVGLVRNPVDPVHVRSGAADGGVYSAAGMADAGEGSGMMGSNSSSGPITPRMVNRARRQGW